MTTIQIPRKALRQSIENRGWTTGWGDLNGDGPTCLHGHIKTCCPKPGDAFIIRQVTQHRSTGSMKWNDNQEDVSAILEWVDNARPVADAELAEVFGPQWEHVVWLVRKVALATPDEIERLSAAWVAARGSAWDDFWVASWDAAWVAARDALSNAARGAAWVAAWGAVSNAACVAARGAASNAAIVAVIGDLIGQHGFTQEHHDMLVGPFEAVFGKIQPC